jgi:hypothetical protein
MTDPMRSRGGVGEPRCASCGAVLTPEEAHYYECHCEGCERADMGREDAQEGRDTVSRHEYEAALARAEAQNAELQGLSVTEAIAFDVLHARTKALEEGLRPFATFDAHILPEDHDMRRYAGSYERPLRVRDIRRARALLAPASPETTDGKDAT